MARGAIAKGKGVVKGGAMAKGRGVATAKGGGGL